MLWGWGCGSVMVLGKERENGRRGKEVEGVPVQLIHMLFDGIICTCISIVPIISSHPGNISRECRQRGTHKRMCIRAYRLLHHTNVILIQMIIT